MNGSNKNITFFFRLIGSFLLAILVWYSVNGSTSNIVTRSIMNIPVSLTSMNELNQKGLVIENEVNYFVNIELRGSEASLDQIDRNDITAEINLDEITTSGSVNLPVVIRGLSNTVILDQTIPDSIQLEVEEITNKEFNPKIITQGKPADGFTVISSTSNETVTISGPGDQLALLDNITGIANVDGLSENSYQLVNLNAYDKDGNTLSEIEITPNTVESEVVIGVTKQVSVTVPAIMNSPDIGYKITNVQVSPASIKIAGNPDDVEQVNSIGVNPISFEGTSINRSTDIESNLILPENVSVIGNSDVAVVKVFIDKVNEKSFNITDFDIIGLAEGLKVERINPGTVAVNISGTSAELNKISASEVKATIDLSGLGAGLYSVPVHVNLSNVSLGYINPNNVEVNITNEN